MRHEPAMREIAGLHHRDSFLESLLRYCIPQMIAVSSTYRPRAAGGRPLAGLEVVEKLLTSIEGGSLGRSPCGVGFKGL